jgi:hypothetical protein
MACALSAKVSAVDRDFGDGTLTVRATKLAFCIVLLRAGSICLMRAIHVAQSGFFDLPNIGGTHILVSTGRVAPQST